VRGKAVILQLQTLKSPKKTARMEQKKALKPIVVGPLPGTIKLNKKDLYQDKQLNFTLKSAR
jgi:hypothetical protein